LHEEYGANVIVTMGADGAVAVLEDGTYVVQPVSVPVVSAAGAGDGVLAGMALAYERGESLQAGLQHGFALAGAVVQTLATADFHVEDYQALLPRILIERLE
jgi:fructose-1-phosphate kinase PfkB-like protein